MAAKKQNDPNQELSVPAAVAEVAKAAVQARAVRPEPETDEAPAEQPPQRSRAEVQADIAAKRAELSDVLSELERRLDVPTRVKTSVREIASDPVRGARAHPKTVAAAAVAAAGLAAGIVLVVRALTR